MRDQICKLSKCNELQVAHIVPREEDDWVRKTHGICEWLWFLIDVSSSSCAMECRSGTRIRHSHLALNTRYLPNIRFVYSRQTYCSDVALLINASLGDEKSSSNDPAWHEASYYPGIKHCGSMHWRNGYRPFIVHKHTVSCIITHYSIEKWHPN